MANNVRRLVKYLVIAAFVFTAQLHKRTQKKEKNVWGHLIRREVARVPRKPF